MSSSLDILQTFRNLAGCRGLRCQFLGSVTEVAQHEASEHVAQKFYCYECADTDFGQANFKFFTHWNSLKNHMNVQHHRSRVYPCKACPRVFYDPSAAIRCKHKRISVPQPLRVNNSAVISLERSEACRRDVMHRLQLDHARMIGISPSAFAELMPEYPAWKLRVHPYRKTISRTTRRGRSNGNRQMIWDETMPGQGLHSHPATLPHSVELPSSTQFFSEPTYGEPKDFHDWLRGLSLGSSPNQMNASVINHPLVYDPILSEPNPTLYTFVHDTSSVRPPEILAHHDLFTPNPSLVPARTSYHQGVAYPSTHSDSTANISSQSAYSPSSTQSTSPGSLLAWLFEDPGSNPALNVRVGREPTSAENGGYAQIRR